MKLTKFEHSCMVVAQDDTCLVIDPGILAQSFKASDYNIAAVVYTHLHGDHFDKQLLSEIVKQNPDLTVYAPTDVLAQITDMQCQKVDTVLETAAKVKSFELSFYGQDHAVIYKNVPCHNVGVLVNSAFYYPGDGFVVPDVGVQVLAVPASAPWMNTAQAMDFIQAVTPKVTFAAHDGLLSDFGKTVTYNWLGQAADAAGSSWQALQTGESIEISSAS